MNKKKRIILASAVFLFADIVSSLYYILITYPGMFNFRGQTYWLQLTYFLIRFSLPVFFGWFLSSKWHKGRKTSKNNFVHIFIKRTYFVLTITIFLLILYITRTFVWDFYMHTFEVIWHIFVNPFVTFGAEGAIQKGTIIARTPVFVYETLFSFMTHISIALMYFSYSLREAFVFTDNAL